MKTLSRNLLRVSFFHRWPARLAVLHLALAAALCGLIGPFFQKGFIDLLMGSKLVTHDLQNFQWLETLSPGAMIWIAFLFLIAAQGLALLSSFVSVREGIFLQTIFSEALYKKMLSIRTDQMGSTTVGEIVSLYATDVAGATAIIDQAIPMGAGIVFPMVFAPIAIQWLCGIPLFSTISVMICIVTLNFILGHRQAGYFLLFKQLAAERTGIVNEWVQNLRLLRILGWVSKFEERIFRKREEETVNRVLMVTNGQIMGSFGSSISFFLNIVGVASLVFLKEGAVSPGELFALLWIFGAFLARPFRQVPWIVTFSLDALTSMRRLQTFLDRESEARLTIDFSSQDSVPNDETSNDLKPLALTVKNLNLEIEGNPILRDVSFDIKAGEFVAIVGEVGSGKSMTVLSLVGETGASFEKLKIGETDSTSLSADQRRSKFAYLSQDGFVMSGNLRDNVAFRYGMGRDSDDVVRKSLTLAQFRIGVEHLSEGLETEIGERGVNFSGGQRQRVGLARAYFLNRPIILLDDCFSAVDVDTENLLLSELLEGAWKSHTRLLVTHRLTVLDRVDRVLFMRGGRVIDSGRFTDLLERSAEVRVFAASVRRAENPDV